MFEISFKFCCKVLPKPIPGSIIIRLLDMPFFSHRLICFSYCIIIWHTSGWCSSDDVILEQALRTRSYPVCCGFLFGKQTCKPYCLPCSKKVRVEYKNTYYICFIYSECANYQKPVKANQNFQELEE